MSLLTSLYTGASGLDASSAELSVVGDNISNANTIGYKQGRTAFVDAMAQSLIGDTPSGGGQLGLGVRTQVIQKILTQGSISNTGLSTDLAIDGQGFFVVKGAHQGSQGTYYTRAGQFTIQEDGFLVNLEGLKVQGYTASPTGVINATSPGDLQIGKASSSPLATATVTVAANLQADAAVIAAPWDPLDPTNTSNFSTSISVFDSLGAPHQVDVYFRKTALGAWDYHALSDGGGITGGTAGVATEIGNGSMTFDTEGKLTTQASAGVFNPLGAVNPQTLTFDLGDPTATGGTGTAGVTQFTAPSATSFLNQDGYASGQLTRVTFDSKGQVMGSFTNGQSRVLGQVAIAGFKAADQLNRVGGSLFTEMPASGSPTVGAASTADRGAIVAGALEQSNVDLSAEFVRMIAAQRQFQANAKTLTTADALLSELMNIKR